MKQTGDYKLSLRYRIRKSSVSYVMIAPFFAFFIFFTVLPIIAAILLSFTDFNMLELPSLVGLENYKRLILDDEIFVLALKNTLVLALINGPVSYLVAFFMAWLINEMPKYLRVFMTLVFYAPSISGNISAFPPEQWQCYIPGSSQAPPASQHRNHPPQRS